MVAYLASALCFLLILASSVHVAILPLVFGTSEVWFMASLTLFACGACFGGWVSGLVFQALRG